MRSIAVVAALLFASSVVHAQPGLTPPQEPDGEQPRAAAPTPPPPPAYLYEVTPYVLAPMPAPIMPERKSEGTATMLSLGTTAAGFAFLAAAGRQDSDSGGLITLGLASLIIGPSAGHIYAGETGRAVGMSLLRGTGFLVFLAGVIKATTVYASDCIDYCNYNEHDDGEAMMWVGGLTFVAATVYDIIDAPRAARRRNAKDRASYQVQPMYVPSVSGAAPGVGLTGRF
jgi:hypothetical protein